jgi:hypothetical protein
MGVYDTIGVVVNIVPRGDPLPSPHGPHEPSLEGALQILATRLVRRMRAGSAFDAQEVVGVLRMRALSYELEAYLGARGMLE